MKPAFTPLTFRRVRTFALGVSFALTLAAVFPAWSQSGEPVSTSALDFERRARLLRADALNAMEPKVSVPSSGIQTRDGGQSLFSRPSLFSNTRYPWKENVVTTIFWCGEQPTARNPTPNHASSWDSNWAGNYGGYDNPDPAARRNFIPVAFTPRQNPFYFALPYNDVTRGTTKPEAKVIIPWFRQTFVQEGHSVLKDRWIAISKGNRVAYAQWEDCGPFRTDHYQYVFGAEMPRPNLNGGAGLDVSPAVRDYLGMDSGSDHTSWRFVEVNEVPSGPWQLYGDNNPFVNGTARRGGGLFGR